MQLKPDTLLQGGKYRIIRTLGQGGFGITYEAEQNLLRRKVAIKEFFMKDCCERDEDTCRMTVGTGSQRALVEKFRGKFIREAQMISGMDHPHIVRIWDVFEENGTAYYVMDYLSGGCLTDKVKKEGPLSEAKAEEYIRQVADALAYIHSQNTVHLDVKPSNILLNSKGEAVLIDFGISKHYDDTGEQTSSTPVGISKGYAPLEQGRDGDVSQFGPSTDIYALGATLYYLVTGIVPPEASIINEDGLSKPLGVSDRIWTAIVGAMQPRRKDRPQSSNAFLSVLDDSPVPKGQIEDEENTIIETPVAQSSPNKAPSKQDSSSLSSKPRSTWLWAIIAGVAVVVIAVILLVSRRDTKVIAPSIDTPLTEQVISENQTVSNQQPFTIPGQEPLQQSESLGSIKVESVPSGASIRLDGRETSKITPALLEGIVPGKHSIRISLDGYNDYNGNIEVSSGRTASLSPSLTIKTTISSPSGTINGHDYVDLGLSVKWATMNVGASSPEGFGSYFAWGETTPKNDYSWDNYRFRISGDSYDNVTLNKYNTKTQSGDVDNTIRLDLSDDAARANWGGTWRMPTEKEVYELRDNCTWVQTSLGGKQGHKLTSKINGNSIFLPFTGMKRGTKRYTDSNGYFWSSSLDSMTPQYATYLYIQSGLMYPMEYYRSDGHPVRPVSN
jgi:serine/threonine protein kinase